VRALRGGLGFVTRGRGARGGDGGAGAHEGPGAPHQGGAPAVAAGDRPAGRRGPGRRALRRAVRLGVLPPRQCQVRALPVPRACGVPVGGSRAIIRAEIRAWGIILYPMNCGSRLL